MLVVGNRISMMHTLLIFTIPSPFPPKIFAIKIVVCLIPNWIAEMLFFVQSSFGVYFSYNVCMTVEAQL